ncbi:MAG: cadherin-like beta sandwich domain-containing protein [Treponema sp.]|nr:cadherin-like beta sandwich domain-containing protein [Treponema sp.]
MKNKHIGKNLKNIILVFAVLPVLFSACDLMGGSFSDFIDRNTYNARVVDINFSSLTSSDKLIVTNQAWMVDPADSVKPGVIQFDVTIDNPYNYDLSVVPVITEFRGPDGRPGPLPANIPVALVTQELLQTDIYRIRIGDTDTEDHKVQRGDFFMIRLDLSTKDGSRKFDPYILNLPVIYDSPLKPASPAIAQSTEFENLGSGFNSTLSWEMQTEEQHAGIRKISLTFIDSTGSPEWIYELQPDNIWQIDDPSKGEYGQQVLTPVITSESIQFKLPYNTNFTPDPDNAGAFLPPPDFVFKVTLFDKNGLSIPSSTGGSPETYLDNLTIQYLKTDGTVENSPWRFSNKDLRVFPLTVPNSVEKVRFIADKSSDPAISAQQQVRWNNETQDKPDYTCSLYIDPVLKTETVVKMEVFWTNPVENSDVKNKSYTYTFRITRLSPNRDSTLKNLIILGAAAQSNNENNYTQYNVVGGFIDPSEGLSVPDALNIDGPVVTNYTVYIPPTVNTIKILGDFLNTSEIYNQNGRPALNGTGGPNLPRPPYPVEQPQYTVEFPDNLYWDTNALKILRDGWEEPVIESKEYTFYINVKPQNDFYETLTRRYVITVIKTDPAGNPDAKLAGLTVNSGGIVYLSDNQAVNPLGSFKPEIFNYSVYVPSNVNTVMVGASTVTGAEIRQITSVNPVTNSYDTIPYNPPLTNITNIQINLPTASDKKRVTFTVYSQNNNPVSNSYTVTITRLLPSINDVPELTGSKNSLTVTWTGAVTWPVSTANMTYEVCYGFNIDDPTQAHAEKAWIWSGVITKPGSSYTAVITGLADNTWYNVWVRPVSSGGIPGEWKSARTTPTDSPSVPYGTPGAAELSGFNVALTPANLTYSQNLAFGAATFSYDIFVPSNTTSVTVTPTAALGVGLSSPVQFNTLKSGDYTDYSSITVTSPDGKGSAAYSFRVYRYQAAPAVTVTSAVDTIVTLNWNSLGTGYTYDVYYSASGYNNDLTAMEISASKITGITGGNTGTPVSCQITNLTNTTPYYFWVRAVSIADSKPGEWSAPLIAVPRSTNNKLSGITIAGGTLDPSPFNPDTLSYSVLLGADGGSITITGVPADSSQRISYNTGSGPSVMANPTNGGKETVTITVTPDSMFGTPAAGQVNTYTIVVSRRFPKPTGITLTPRDKSLIVNWNAVAGAAIYEVFYLIADDNPPLAPADTDIGAPVQATSGTTYTIPNLVNGTTYNVWVRAKNSDGSIIGESGGPVQGSPRSYSISCSWITPPGFTPSEISGISITSDYIGFPIVKPGDKVTVAIKSPYGIKPGTFTVKNGAVLIPFIEEPNNSTEKRFTFTMQDGDVALSAEFLTGYLSSLSVSAVGGSVSQLYPAFSSAVFDYTVQVTNGVSSLQVFGSSAEGAAVSSINNTLNGSPIIITVTPPVGSGATSSRQYNLNVNKLDPVTLSSLSLSYGSNPVVNVPINSADNNFISVPNAISSININAVKNTYTGNGVTAAVTGDGSWGPLASGQNSINVTVSLKFGDVTVEQKTYSIIVTRLPPLELSYLTISYGGNSFTDSPVSYTTKDLTVINNIGSITISAASNIGSGGGLTSEVTGVTGLGEQLSLNEGSNSFDVTVSLKSGVNVVDYKTYTINVTRLPLLELSSLTISYTGTSITDSPVTYTTKNLNIPNLIDSVDVSAVSNISSGGGFTAEVTGIGAHSSLNPGLNSFNVTVSLKSGVNVVEQKIYTVNITRLLPVALNSFTISYTGNITGSNSITDNFANGSTYSLSVPYDIDSVDITATPNDPGGDVTADVTGTGQYSSLSVGLNTISLSVSAVLGSSTDQKTYTIYITREPD